MKSSPAACWVSTAEICGETRTQLNKTNATNMARLNNEEHGMAFSVSDFIVDRASSNELVTKRSSL